MLLRYSLLWFALALIAIANGTLREQTYGKHISELSAHQLSTLTGIIFSGAFVYFIHRFWPFESSNQAWLIGVIWFIATIIFEFVFGHFIVGYSWALLLNDYNIFQGRVWSLFLVWVLLMPVVIHKYTWQHHDVCYHSVRLTYRQKDYRILFYFFREGVICRQKNLTKRWLK